MAEHAERPFCRPPACRSRLQEEMGGRRIRARMADSLFLAASSAAESAEQETARLQQRLSSTWIRHSLLHVITDLTAPFLLFHRLLSSHSRRPAPSAAASIAVRPWLANPSSRRQPIINHSPIPSNAPLLLAPEIRCPTVCLDYIPLLACKLPSCPLLRVPSHPPPWRSPFRLVDPANPCCTAHGRSAHTFPPICRMPTANLFCPSRLTAPNAPDS
jgi:hypothetical protein